MEYSTGFAGAQSRFLGAGTAIAAAAGCTVSTARARFAGAFAAHLHDAAPLAAVGRAAETDYAGATVAAHPADGARVRGTRSQVGEHGENLERRGQDRADHRSDQ